MTSWTAPSWTARTHGLTVEAFATEREPMPGTMTCESVAGVFRESPGLRSIVVAAAPGARVINRAPFFQALAGPRGYGWALHRQRPVGDLPPEAGGVQITLMAGTPLARAGLEVLAAAASSGDDVLVDMGGGTVATIAVSTLFSVLARHHEEQAQIASFGQRRFQALLENLLDAVVVLAPDGTVLYASPSAGNAAPTTSAFDLVHPDDRVGARAWFARAMAFPGEALRHEFRSVAPAGDVRRLEAVATNKLDDPAIGGIIVNYRDITERRVLEDRLRFEALHDPLTGLANRTLLWEQGRQALERMRRSGDAVTVVYLDLDGFKSVNDRWGHRVGDELLRAVAEALLAETRGSDTLARLGGDEFALLVEAVPSDAVASTCAARMHSALSEPIHVAGHEIFIRGSIGLATTRDPSIGIDELLRRADLAMYAAKARGKDRTAIWDDGLEADLLDDHELTADLAKAAAAGQLFIEFQPIVDLRTGRVQAMEALTRWQHPTRGLLGPDRFIPLAERTGAIAVIGNWVLEQACREASEWARESGLVLCVNMSAARLGEPGLAATVASTLERTGWPATRLELELTETALVTHVGEANRSLVDLKALGVRVAVDDFGSGYSSLSYLRDFPIDTVKIDKSFVDRVDSDHSDAQLVAGIVKLAHNLGLDVTAEGVEEAEQAHRLRRMGCDRAQGFLYARPGPLAAVMRMFAEAGREVAGHVSVR